MVRRFLLFSVLSFFLVVPQAEACSLCGSAFGGSGGPLLALWYGPPVVMSLTAGVLTGIATAQHTSGGQPRAGMVGASLGIAIGSLLWNAFQLYWLSATRLLDVGHATVIGAVAAVDLGVIVTDVVLFANLRAKVPPIAPLVTKDTVGLTAVFSLP